MVFLDIEPAENIDFQTVKPKLQENSHFFLWYVLQLQRQARFYSFSMGKKMHRKLAYSKVEAMIFKLQAIQVLFPWIL